MDFDKGMIGSLGSPRDFKKGKTGSPRESKKGIQKGNDREP